MLPVRVTLLPSGPVPAPEVSIWSVLVRRSALIEAVPLDFELELGDSHRHVAPVDLDVEPMGIDRDRNGDRPG